MRQRWCVAGLLDAERRFRRVKGYRHMKPLIDALNRLVHPQQLDNQRQHRTDNHPREPSSLFNYGRDILSALTNRLLPLDIQTRRLALRREVGLIWPSFELFRINCSRNAFNRLSGEDIFATVTPSSIDR